MRRDLLAHNFDVKYEVQRSKQMTMMKQSLVLLLALLAVGLTGVSAFQGPKPLAPRSFVATKQQPNAVLKLKSSGALLFLAPNTKHRLVETSSSVALFLSGDNISNNLLEDPETDEDDTTVATTSASGDFDGGGFANYLLPYALAAIGSVAVTAAFVKFVLLDY